jgi:transposase
MRGWAPSPQTVVPGDRQSAPSQGKLVSDYVETTKGKLKLYFLPGYAPELNPDELVWSHMKRTGAAKRPLASNEVLQERIEADLIRIQNDRALVRSFFKAPDVAYIADGCAFCFGWDASRLQSTGLS